MNAFRKGNPEYPTILWPPLIKGTLVKRYKRFLADVILEDGTPVTAHCPNSGSMAQCSDPGAPVYLSISDNPKRKLKYSWVLIQMPTSLVGVNTLIPNKLVAAAATHGRMPELAGYDGVQTEAAVGDHTRLDVKLTADGRRDCYVEVKNCTLVNQGLAQFPDARTVRGQKHLEALARLKAEGHRAVIFFLIQRMDAELFFPAEKIDPQYSHTLRQVAAQGVEIVVYDVVIDLKGIRIGKPLPYAL